jgi:predicted RNA-binding Zn ribbon-like protein
MLSRAQAAERTAANRLLRETAEALARYEGARCQVDRLRKVILPQLQENLALVRQGYQAGAANFAFTDVQLAVEAQNDARLRLVGAQRELWRAVADLQGLMQLEVDEEMGASPATSAAPCRR